MSHLLLPGLQDEANIVRLPVFDEIRDRLACVTGSGGALLVSGDHGCGKRVALLTCLSEQTLPHVVVKMPPKPSDKDMVRLLYHAVHQDRDDFELRDMQDELVDTLAGQPQIIVIDGAEELTPKASGQLHYLRSRPNANWTINLLGGPDAGPAISTSARLQGDVLATVTVPRLAGDELIGAVRTMHTPLLGMADQDLLLLIDKQVCKGLLKNWARFLQHALHLQQNAARAGMDVPVLDVQFARAIVKCMPAIRVTKRR